jgi:preprotein translocase subunit SecD
VLPTVVLLILVSTISLGQIKNDEYLQTGWYYVNVDNSGIKRFSENDSANYYINPAPIVTLINFSEVYLDKNVMGNNIIVIKLDENGKLLWENATFKWVMRKVAFVYKNKVVSIGKVLEKIESGITTIYIKGEPLDLLNKLKNNIDQEIKDLKH